MRSPLTKIAVAAGVVVACAIGLSVWRTTGSSIALADVVANMEKAKAERQTSTLRIWNQRMTGEDPNKRYDYRESRDTSLMSQVYGTKSSAEELDPNRGETTIHETFFQAPKHALIHVYPRNKKYYRIEYDDGWGEQWQGSAEEFVKKFVACKCESLGRSIIDGVEVEGFRSTDPKLGDGAYRGESKIQFDYKLWVDVKKGLPVRCEYNGVYSFAAKNKKEYWHLVTEGIQWDVPVTAADFEPVIPDDYTGTVIRYPAHLTEDTLIQGLKLLVELLGRYPENIGEIVTDDKAVLRWAQRSETPAASRWKEETKGLTDEQINNQRVNYLKPIRGGALLYLRFQWHDIGSHSHEKDPAYYGKTVTPTDPDKVLVRWKLSDQEYRVIFGDLHTETVSAEKLAELEKGMSK